MSSGDTSQSAALEIEAMKAAVGVTSDAELADFIGVTGAAISQWRKRNSVPDSAHKKLTLVSRYGKRADAMKKRRAELGHGALYAGRCLAILVAPSREAAERGRVSPLTYLGTLNWYATYFHEIELACAEEIASRIDAGLGANATEALLQLAEEKDQSAIYKRITDRAEAWSSGTASVS